MIVEFNTFASRLQEACKTGEPAEIARLTELTYQTVKNYLLGRLPTAEVLIKLSEKLGVSIHWLLTGVGPQFVGDFSTTVEFRFDERDKKVLADIAAAGGISFDEAVVHLVREALAHKGFGEMPGWIPVPVFETMPEDIERQVFQHLDNLPESTRMAETKKLIGALVTRAATP